MTAKLIFHSLGACQDTKRSPNLAIIHRLPDEVLLEIFDSYRQSITDQYEYYWRKKYAWFNLAHVCRRWRAATFASSSRLDLNVIVRPVKPNAIKTVPSGHLPILIDYEQLSEIDVNGTTVWRMCAGLRHRNRVREISFGGFGAYARIYSKFIEATHQEIGKLLASVSDK
jgi:hypothetical protein